MTKPTLYLHIGFHKTGTTSIQTFLAANVGNLAAQQCLYPQTGRGGNTHFLLANSLKKANMHLQPGKLYRELKQEIEAANLPKIVVSSECFMESIPPALIARHFAQLNVHVVIVVYLRRQDLWLQSLYNEVIRDPSRRYTGSITNMREVRTNVADYNAVLLGWEKAFGEENIRIRVFEKEQMPLGLYQDFMDVLGLRMSPEFYIPDSNEAKNVGFPVPIVLALRAMNHIAMTREMYKKMINELAEIAKDPEYVKTEEYALMSAQEAESILSRYSHGNEEIARKHLNRPDGRLFYSAVQHGPKRKYELSPEMERSIFLRLPADMQAHCVRMYPRLGKDLVAGRPFFPNEFPTEVDRLRAVIQRMRVELNWLYDKRH